MSYHGGPGYGYPQAPQPNLPTPMPNMPTPMPNMPPPQPTITSQPESESSPPSSHMGNGQPPMGQPMPMGDVPPGMCPQCRVGKLEPHFSTMGVVCCVICFPCGMCFCCMDSWMDKKCPGCGFTILAFPPKQ